MPVTAANTLVLVAAAYLLVGVVFALFFVVRGASAIDPAAASSGLGFRVFIVPGAVLLWPWLARKWPRGDAGLPPLAQARNLRRRHLPLWLVIGPLSLAGLALALVVRDSGNGGIP